MAFTPSNLSIAQLGSLKITIADINANVVSASDLWTSGIPDIHAVIPIMTTFSASSSPLSISYTGTTGTIHIVRILSETTVAIKLLVLSGFATDMTW